MSVKAAEKAAGAAAPISRRRVAIDTHGCKLNQADSSQLARRFQEAGCQLVPTAAEADIYILNTCTVTATADAKARQALRAARRANPHALVVAAGCYPQRAAAELAQLPAVSMVIGNTEKDQLVAKVMAVLDKAAPPAGHPAPLPFSETAPGRNRAMVKIQEGCDQVCAYCIVPKVRGRERSIPPETIIGQLAQRVAEGCREAALTGTQLGTYGFDLSGINLAGLLRRILAETDIERLRVSSLQPQEIGPELLDLWMADHRLCPHFHLPLQSGSDAILKVMRRRYTAAQFAATVARIRRAIPAAGITADVIVGFPGETDAHFQESLDLVRAMQFSDLHIFPYSQRPGTTAAYLQGQVAPPLKKERAAQMQALAQESFGGFRRRQLGQTRPVLWESSRSEQGLTQWRGLTDNYIRVHTAGAREDGENLRNAITPARLTALAGNSVLAEPELR